MSSPISERRVLFLIGAVQFVNILDFMMVSPLGQDFVRALHFDASKVGLITGIYTASAAVSGVLGSFFLDRFDRRKALAFSMLGLVLGTLSGALAFDLWSLLAARILAGFFGGPATSLSLAIIADTVPRERLGRAMGAVMGAFSVASALGVPLGLRLALWGDWRTPFLVVGGLGALLTVGVIALLPPMTGHLTRSTQVDNTPHGLLRPTVLLSYAMTAVGMGSMFLLVPNIATYVQENLHYPRELMDRLYLAGGIASFFAVRAAGGLADRFGSFRVGFFGVLGSVAVVYVSFVNYQAWLPIWGMYVAFMVATSFRNAPYNALTSKVPAPQERARFMSVQSVVQHLAAAIGAIGSSQFLRELPDRTIEGIPQLATLSLFLILFLPALMWIVERRVRHAVA